MDPMPKRLKLVPPVNIADPLSELTPGRRIWAAYLKAGYNRNSFASAAGLSYSTVSAWEKPGEQAATPDPKNLSIVADLVGYSVDELLHGQPPRATLTLAEQKNLDKILADVVSLGAQLLAGAKVQAEHDRLVAKYLAASGWTVAPPPRRKPKG